MTHEGGNLCFQMVSTQLSITPMPWIRASHSITVASASPGRDGILQEGVCGACEMCTSSWLAPHRYCQGLQEREGSRPGGSGEWSSAGRDLRNDEGLGLRPWIRVHLVVAKSPTRRLQLPKGWPRRRRPMGRATWPSSEQIY